jgi:molybdopterin/thiamine biosynthesis adenylyltransferase
VAMKARGNQIGRITDLKTSCLAAGESSLARELVPELQKALDALKWNVQPDREKIDRISKQVKHAAWLDCKWVTAISKLPKHIPAATTDRIGTKKVESARIAIAAPTPEVRVVGYDEMLTDANVERIIAGYDVILDGTDTFETRYTLNDAAVAAGIPVVHASVYRFEGQLTVFKPVDGPCYRCLYPTPPPPELAPGCSVAGVLGVVPGLMGLLQTSEALKLILGIGDPLVGRLLLFDALDATFIQLRLRRDPACPVCSDAAIEARRAGTPLPVVRVGDAAPVVLGARS